MHYLQCPLATNSYIWLPVLLRRTLLWFCLLIPILCLSFSVTISYSLSYVTFCKNPTPSVSIRRNGNICTSVMCESLHVQWRLWYGAGEGLSSLGFLQYRLKKYRQSSHVGTFLPHLWGKWLAEVCLTSGRTEVIILLCLIHVKEMWEWGRREWEPCILLTSEDSIGL